jgi:hypothetical protein
MPSSRDSENSKTTIKDKTARVAASLSQIKVDVRLRAIMVFHNSRAAGRGAVPVFVRGPDPSLSTGPRPFLSNFRARKQTC